ELFHTRPHLNSVATKSLVQRKLEKEGGALDVLHFSCPAHFDSHEPLNSGIQLAGEKDDAGETAGPRWLTAAEILQLRMPVDLVTVSACDPVLKEDQTGDALMVFASALIHAGAPSVVVNLWKPPAAARSLLMQRFYQELRKPGSQKGDAA